MTSTLYPYEKERELMYTDFNKYLEYRYSKEKLIEKTCKEFNETAVPLWSVRCTFVRYGIELDLRMATPGSARLAIDTFRWYISQLLGVEYERIEDEEQLSFDELTALFGVVKTEEFDAFNFAFDEVVYLYRYPVTVRLVSARVHLPPWLEYLKPERIYIHLRPSPGWETEYELLYNALQYLKAVQCYLNYVLNYFYEKKFEYELKHGDP